MLDRDQDKILKDITISRLKERNINIDDIAEIVYKMQSVYDKKLTMDMCKESIDKVIGKREMQHAILVGIELDFLTEQKLIREPLLSIIEADEGLFGIDETLAFGSVYGYGSIALTTFGYLDKVKLGILEEVDKKVEGKVNTFLDDIVAAIAAAASGRIAHHSKNCENEQLAEIDDATNEI